MKALNVEIKAKCSDTGPVRDILISRNARFIGEDHQVDTYFKTDKGRLKLREGNIENSLIYYERENTSAPRESEIILYKTEPGSSLKEILSRSNGIKVVVDKKREIYFIENVKFHIDIVESLGTFVEIEAISENGAIDRNKLLEQCTCYLKLFKIADRDLISLSYSDLLLQRQGAENI